MAVSVLDFLGGERRCIQNLTRGGRFNVYLSPRDVEFQKLLQGGRKHTHAYGMFDSHTRATEKRIGCVRSDSRQPIRIVQARGIRLFKNLPLWTILELSQALDSTQLWTCRQFYFISFFFLFKTDGFAGFKVFCKGVKV